MKSEGLAFSEIVRDTRERLSRHYLTQTTLAYGPLEEGLQKPGKDFRHAVLAFRPAWFEG